MLGADHGEHYLQIQAAEGSWPSGSDANPEVYQLNVDTEPYDCSDDTRGMIYVAKPSGGGDQDSLCYCGWVSDGFKTHCFNP